MNDKDEKIACSLCNNHLRTKYIDDVQRFNKTFDVYLCEKCMVGVTIPTPSLEDISELYSTGSYRSGSGKRFNPLVEYLIYVSRILRKRRIQKYIKQGRILDIGCGRGLFLEIMRRDGWDVTGVEYNKETALHVFETYGIKAQTETSIRTLPDKSFDVITLNHVLEHTYRPAELIKECRRLLRKDGLLVIAVPNIHSLQASAGGKVWFHLDLPFHINHFSEKGLSKLLNRNSFSLLKTRQFDLEYGPFGWLQTLLNLSGLSENLLYNMLKNPELRNKTSNVAGWELILTFMLLPVYFPVSVMLSVIESLLLKRGGTIEVYAIKT